ncbi:MAG: hypothetical protein H6Q65_566 [Firmicutes bacterium]|nr:hypothetical protein [Bacillota bacterium]
MKTKAYGCCYKNEPVNTLIFVNIVAKGGTDE